MQYIEDSIDSQGIPLYGYENYIEEGKSISIEFQIKETSFYSGVQTDGFK